MCRSFVWLIRCGLAVVLLLGPAVYAAGSIQGRWQTFDHDSKKRSSIIYIWKVKDKYYGKIQRTFPIPGHPRLVVCSKCKGQLRDRPIIGLVIITGLTQDGDQYQGGSILDPRDGKVYHCKIRLGKHGRRLYVRGYIGIPLLGKTDTWYRL